jgi:Protein of unknown function (DUF3667)
MQNNCTHCANLHEGNFCNYCGQKKFHRIDRKYIWDEVQYTLIHFNKGFLYSIKSIAKNPGKTARSFVDGDRVNHYKPISLAFVLAGISAFLSIKVIKLYKAMEALPIESNNTDFMKSLMHYNIEYNSFFMLAFAPLVAIFTWFVFKKWGNNYYEHVVMNAFGVSLYLIFNILILYPILYFFKDDYGILNTVSFSSFLLIPIYMGWFFKGFYPETSLKTIILRILFLIFLLLVAYILLIILVAIFIGITNPAAFKQFAPKK